MAPTEANDLLTGSLGYFWPQQSTTVMLVDAHARAGYLSHQGLGVDVTLLVDDLATAVPGALGGRAPTVQGFVGACEDSGVVVLDVVGQAGGRLSFGGGRASTETYRAQTLVTTSEVLDIKQLLLDEATVRFRSSSLFDWAHQRAYDSTTRTDPATGLVTSATLELLPTKPEIAGLQGVGELAVEADWSLTTRTETGVKLDLALEMTVRSRQPQMSHELLRHLGALQVLISALAHGFVMADGGRAHLPGLDSRGSLWNSVLMRDPSGSRISPYSRKQPPLVDLPTIGGVAGLSRWVGLAHRHQRVMAPIENRWRRGRASTELQLVECAVAIEYWIAAHRRTAAWARAHSFYPLLAAERAAREFAAFVGDRRVWSDRFWRTYTALKHEPNAVLDEEETGLLAESAYYLLLGLLLDRVAHSKAPSRRLFSHHRLSGLGRAVRDKLGT